MKLNEDEQQLLKLGPRFIFNDPRTAARRRTTELATLKRKIQARFYENKVRPGRPVDQFIAELDIMLQNLHDVPISSRRPEMMNNSNEQRFQLNIPDEWIISSQSETLKKPLKKKETYSRTVKRLKHKFRLTNTVLQKTDKSKVFHIGRLDDYHRKSREYMEKTQAYVCLGTNDPLPDLIERTNKYLLDLRLKHWISQKQYEQLCVDRNDVELSHLYYLPKAHKVGTPLRPIISGLRHPTIKISKLLDLLLRPLFDQISSATTVNSGFDLVKQLRQWSNINMRQETLFCAIDIADLYTMIPQTEGVLSLKRMMDQLELKQIEGLKVETIIRLSRFVMQNNYFSYNGQFYHQMRGGAMGSPLTLTMANCYMFFFEREIFRQISNGGGLYVRYIDDIFLAINWPLRHLSRQIERWNKFDLNIRLSANIGFEVDFLDLHIENRNGHLQTRVYHKPSYEPYYLPFNSIHPLHMKKNIPFTMLLRTVRYCSSFHSYVAERESLRVALLLNKYPGSFIAAQFDSFLKKFNIGQAIDVHNYSDIREQVICSPKNEKMSIEYDTHLFVHFTYCTNMRSFPRQFHTLWQKYFDQSPISQITPILGTRNVDNLHRQMVQNK